MGLVLVDLELCHFVPLGLAVNLEVDDVWGFYQVLREFLAGALKVFALNVGNVLAILICLNQEEALGIFWVAVPLELYAAWFSIAGFGVPVDVIQEGVGVFGLDVELNVNENHATDITCGMVEVHPQK